MIIRLRRWPRLPCASFASSSQCNASRLAALQAASPLLRALLLGLTCRGTSRASNMFVCITPFGPTPLRHRLPVDNLASLPDELKLSAHATACSCDLNSTLYDTLTTAKKQRATYRARRHGSLLHAWQRPTAALWSCQLQSTAQLALRSCSKSRAKVGSLTCNQMLIRMRVYCAQCTSVLLLQCIMFYICSTVCTNAHAARVAVLHL
jgi:hypothetical protein